jgi:hypothetical protein
MSRVRRYPYTHWKPQLDAGASSSVLADLEGGNVLYFPELAFSFQPEEETLFETQRSRSAKNISYRPDTGEVKGAQVDSDSANLIANVLWRYADLTLNLVRSLFPDYIPSLRRARTSFRTVEIAGRPSSVAKDDTRLHVDAFPSSPVRGERILRVFSNVNPSGLTRNWRLGEPFEPHARRFAPRVSPPFPASHLLLRALGITKSRRSLYDHYMLRLHDLGKQDTRWQQSSPQERIDFPADSTWLCFTDEVLHAALSGRFLLEQTYHVPVSAMRQPERSPLRVLERIVGVPMSGG